MEEMGCGFKWLFADEDLRNTPSFKAGIGPQQEQTFRTKMAMLIQTIGSKSRLTQLAMNTSIIFMHRFFMYRTVRQFPRLHLAVAFAFAGGKVEESFCKLEHLVRSSADVIRSNKNREFLDKSDPLTYEMDCQWRNKMEALLHSNCSTESAAYQDMRKIILECEAEIYAVIGFNLSIIHPHNFVVRMCSMLGSESTKEISHYAYNLATASSQLTMLCLKYKPEFIAVMCLSIAAKAHNVEFKVLIEGRVWYQAFDDTVVLSDVEAVSREFMGLAKGYPFWKDANGQQVFLNRRNVPGQARAQGSTTPQPSRQQQPSHVVHGTPQSHPSSQSNPASAEYSVTPSQALRPPSNPEHSVALSSLVSLQAQAQQGYTQGGGSAHRQNPASVGNGRNGTSLPSTVTPSRDQAHLSRSHQRPLPQHIAPQQQQQPVPPPHHHHHSQQHQHHPHLQQQQQRPAVPPVSSSHTTTATTRPSSQHASSHPGDVGSFNRHLHSVTGSSQSLAAHPSSLHHMSSSSSLSHLVSSSSSRDLHSSQSAHPPNISGQGQTQRQPRSMSEEGRQRQSTQPSAQELARSQSLHRSRPETGLGPVEPSVAEDRRPRVPHRAALAAHPSLPQHHLHHAQPLATDLSQPQQHHQQQQPAVSRQPPQAGLQQQPQHRQQATHLAQLQQQQQNVHPRQQLLATAGLQHYQQQGQSAQPAHRQTHSQRPQQQQYQSRIALNPKEAGELSPHTPPLPYPGDLVTPPFVSQSQSNPAPPTATAAHTLPGSGDAPQVAGASLSRHPQHRNGQGFKGSSSSHRADGSSSRAGLAAAVLAPENSRSSAQTKPLLAEHKSEPSTSAPFLNDRVLKIKLEPCSSSPVQSAAKVKCEPLATSPGDEKVLLSGASSSFTKPQDSPSNPRIKIKVKRDPASNERHSVKYADSGLKIKIKPPKPEGEVEAGLSLSGHSSRSSTPREEGEVEGTPSPASSTSSGRKSEGLRIRLSVPKPDGSSSGGCSKRDSDQWSNGVGSERESSCHRSHHHNHHHGRHHKSKKHSKHSRHESKSSSKRSASGDIGDERPPKASRSETAGSGIAPSLSLQTGGYPGLASTSFSTSDSLHHGGFSITDAFSTTMPNDIFDDDDEDTLPSIPLTPVDAIPQVTSHHERFQQLMNQHNPNGTQGSSGSRNTSSKL
ncbi:cyclin-T1 [Elysia marginata]|uniref:Cyclin-T1 n=1 Tax=Elysia marginata TaxID=1093978 RepID=A0AAV4GK12_9GAST|nr:cyclin-T1 [Elysia marginata]